MASDDGDEIAVRFPTNTERDPATGRPVSNYGKIKEATSVATSGAAAKARMVQMPMNQVSKAVHDLWKEYERKLQQRKEASANKKNKSVPDGLNDAQHAQEVFVLLASLGERLLALEVFDPAVYTQVLEDVKTSLAAVKLPVLREQFDLLTQQQQYPVTAALVFSAFFHPMPIYRGYGACVLEDWDWGCLDVDALLKEKIKEQGGWISRLGKDPPVAQPNQAILEGTDRVIMQLQSKSSCKDFLVKKPAISGLVSTYVRLEPRPKKDVKKDLELLEDFTKEVKKRGHPGPAGVAISTWSLPFATWRSKYTSVIMTQDWTTTMMQQQDPGRILHAYLNKEVLSLSDGHILVLPPGTLAETLACWMEGLPGTRHRTVRWHNLDTVEFAVKMKKASKAVYRKLGQYPLPNTFVVAGELVQRQPSSALVRQVTPTEPPAPSSPVITNEGNDADGTQAPPPYVKSDHAGNETASPPLQLRERFDNESASALPLPQSRTASPPSPNPIRRKPMPSREVSSSSALGFVDEKADHSETPSADSLTAIQQSIAGNTLATGLPPRAPSPLATGNYLDLLNEVAQGRITPQQLSHMLKEQRTIGTATSTSLRAEGARGSKAIAQLPPQNDMGEFQEPWSVSIGPAGIFEMPAERDPVETDGIATSAPRIELPNNEVRDEDEARHAHQDSTLAVSKDAKSNDHTSAIETTHQNATRDVCEAQADSHNTCGAEESTENVFLNKSLSQRDVSPLLDSETATTEDDGTGSRDKADPNPVSSLIGEYSPDRPGFWSRATNSVPFFSKSERPAS